ncbi:sensor histidine kinase [Paenibacillus polysaccharolyticus]|uniref:sensor histidine kinase n=1 Tax=Paenibacillus polysaccharolyticus TaxID=582692 RepID=UPI0023EEC8CF|nr:HAMP domain-containing sensor histidine kinase [Paenibacillus polysaccharolyticus]
MKRLFKKPRKRIQVNLLLRVVLSATLAAALNNLLIFFITNVDAWENKWIQNLYPYFITPFFVLIFILTFLLSTRRIVKDLMSLERGLQTISEGNLSFRVSMNRQDELGRVADNINQMTERLQQQMLKEREIENSKMEMITGISHDLRTPLTSIIGYIELLRTNTFQNQEEYDRFVHNTYNKAIHLKKLLDDLFEYTKLNSVDATLDYKQVDLFQLVDQLLFDFEPIAQENHIQLHKDIGDSPIIMSIDSNKMARAIDNLLMNALKYSFKPGMIYVRIKKELTTITLEIENNGTPLTREQENKLFDRFYKVDHSRSSEGIQTGSGLGLSISKNIVELHRGTIALDHEDTRFTFKITLPIHKPD